MEDEKSFENTVNFVYKNKEISINTFDNKEFISGIIIYHKNFYEVQLLDQILKCHPKHNTIVDVGANIGNHVVYFENYLSSQKIICFEPDVNNFTKLCSNIRKKSTVVYNLALSDEYGKCSICRKEKNNSGTGFVSPGIDVETTTLDCFNIKDLTLLKIDVEGHEFKVLKGSIETIKKCKPVIFMEVSDERAKNLLFSLGYEIVSTFWYGPSPTYEFVYKDVK